MINLKNIHNYLGVPKYLPEEEMEKDEVGVSTGLAWTETGGDIIYVEATTMKGKGHLTLTGQLGDVMKESAQAALSYIRSRAKILGINDDIFSKTDLHIHVPAGAIPKDGPSAGITMATAIASALTGRACEQEHCHDRRSHAAWQGASDRGTERKDPRCQKNGNTQKVIIPKRNRKDLEDIPKYIKKDMEFIFAETMDDVFKAALKKAPDRKQKAAVTRKRGKTKKVSRGR